ncbi:MAG: SPOR domain-containing protein [Bacteroidota bacterium]
MIKKVSSLLVAGMLFVFSVVAQSNSSYFTVQVGSFINASPEQFKSIKDLGFLHTAKLDGNQITVYIGGFNDRASAQKVRDKVAARGWSGAFVQERLLADGQTATVVQLGIRSTKKSIDWDRYFKAGPLFVLLKGSEVKIVTGTFPDIAAAKKELPAIRKAGFKDAFVKRVNSVFLHEVNNFEADGVKRELIPLDLDKRVATSSSNPPANVPGSYDYVGTKSVGKVPTNYSTNTAQPRIRGKIKRRSVVELQKVLKSEGAYKSSLDGYYGKGTSGAYRKAIDNNRAIQKYAVLAKYVDRPGLSGSSSKFQQAIDNLLDDPNAPAVLDSYNTPVAKGYQAYLLYTAIGPNSEVNALMNSAIREAFAGQKLANQPPFDYRATYAYQDLEQLILHLHYLHSAPGEEVAVPCWLFQIHPEATAGAYSKYSGANSNFTMQSCDEFLFWDEVRTMQAIAVDLNGDATLNKAALAEAASKRAQLYVSPKAVNSLEKKRLENWNRSLWNGLNGWAARDPMHERIVTALKITYYQSQVRLEDFFMDKGFDKSQAEALALSTLQTLVGYHLERFA